MWNIPALRFGTDYHSANTSDVVDLGSKEVLAKLGLVVDGIIQKDCRSGKLLEAAFKKLRAIPMQARVAMCQNACTHFLNDALDCGGVSQTFDEYIDVLTRTSGLSKFLAGQVTDRIGSTLRNMEDIVMGLSRGMAHSIIDSGIGWQWGSTIRLVPRVHALGCCMPGNSPGVHVIWLPALAFGIPVLIRPGSAEPFTPYRLIQAFIKAGFPKEVFGYYPCEHSGANLIPTLTKGAIVFGSDETVKQWKENPLVHVHGSGFSKLILGEDRLSEWKTLIPALAQNVSANSGRSCYAVSRIMVPGHGKEIAAALAEELAKIIPRPLHHPDAFLSAMAMPERATAVNQVIDEELKTKGAIDMSAPHRTGSRLVEFEGRTYMLPTVIYCEKNDHPLANQEFLFPFTAVTEVSNDQAFAEMGPTLALGVYTNNEELKRRARMSHVSLVSVNKSTSVLDRNQPHEHSLFDLFYERLSYVEG